MKRGMMFLVLFFIGTSHIFAAETCQYIEHEGHIEFDYYTIPEREKETKTIELIIKDNKRRTLEINGVLLDGDYYDIVSYGYSESKNEIALITKDENDEFSVIGYKRVGDKWEKYQLLDYNPKSRDLYYAVYYPYIAGQGDRNLTILVKDKNGNMQKVFNGYSGFDRNIYIYSGKPRIMPNFNEFLFVTASVPGYYDRTIGFSVLDVNPWKLSDGLGEYGLISFKEKGYARYLNQTYSYTEYGRVLPKYYAYRTVSESGKYYIQFNGEKGEEYDYILTNYHYLQFLGDNKFIYYAEDNDKKYTIEIICE